jgi:hypothetical protein
VNPGSYQGTGGGFESGRGNYQSSGWGGGMSSGYTGHVGQQSGMSGGMGNYGQTGQTGQRTGRGPKNWTRSDDRIRDDVNERLAFHSDIDASEIEVEVHNGEVTLKGTVDHRQSKRAAEDIADGVHGVKQVHNQIRVESREHATAGTQGSQQGTGSTSNPGSTTSSSSATAGVGAKK